MKKINNEINKEHFLIADKYMTKMKEFYDLSGANANIAKMFDKEPKIRLSKKVLYKKILEIQTEWRNDAVAQEKISNGLKEFLNKIIDEQVEKYSPSNPFTKLKSIFVKSR